jgi:hypothetical protein
LLLDDDGIMLSDISGECMLLARSNYFLDMSVYVMPSSSRSMHSPDMSDNMMPSSSRSNYFSDMSDNMMPSSSINTFSPMTHTK